MPKSSTSPNGGKWKFKMPHGWIVIILILLAVCLFTYIIPSGEYVRYQDEVTGKSVVDPASFSYVDQTPVSPLKIPQLFLETCVSNAQLIFVVLFITDILYVVVDPRISMPGSSRR